MKLANVSLEINRIHEAHDNAGTVIRSESTQLFINLKTFQKPGGVTTRVESEELNETLPTFVSELAHVVRKNARVHELESKTSYLHLNGRQ